MEAREKTLSFLTEPKYNKLTVPFFQRRYVWNRDNWSEMLQTLQNKDIHPFLGSIILKQHENNDVSIIDGQQRLTTLTILTKAIFDSFDKDKRDNGELKKNIETILFYKKNLLEPVKKGDVKIKHSKVDADDYNKIINSGLFDTEELNLDEITERSSLLLQCYKYFREEFKKETEEDLLELFSRLYFEQDEDKKILVLITLNYKDINEQTIFDTINRAGVRLSTADIIKNNLFKRALDTCENDKELKNKVVEYYDKYWNDTFYSAPKIIETWDFERVFGNVKHSNLEFLLYCIAAIKWSNSKDLFSNLEMVYEKETSIMSHSEILLLIREIKEYADIFKKYIEDFKSEVEDDDKHKYFGYNNSVERLMLILQKFGVQMFYPYVLKRLYEVEQNEYDPQLIEDFHILESFIVRRKISPTKHTYDYTSKCGEIIINGAKSLISSDLQNQDSGVSDTDVKENLLNTKDDAAKMILFMIELYRRKDGDYDFDKMEYKYTLEHIMPKSWQKNWSNVKIIENGNELPIDSEEGIAYRKGKIQALGNKTLLTGVLNSVVRNSSFDIKIEGSGTKKGYRNHTELLLTKDIVDTYESDKQWDEAHIIERTNSLYKEFLKLWPSFSLEDDEQDGYEYDDPNALLEEIVSNPVSFSTNIINSDVQAFIDYCNSKNKNIYAYKDLLLLAILENGNNGSINLNDCAKYFSDFYDDRRQNGLLVEGIDSFIVKQHPYTISDLEKEILKYPFDRFQRKSYMEYNSETNEISIVRPIWNQLSEQEIVELKNGCKDGITDHFNKL